MQTAHTEHQQQQPRSIGLIHLSSGNGNPARFVDEIKGIVDCDVDVWVAGESIEKKFKLEPF